MLVFFKGIEAGDWLTFIGTLVSALIGALIAGGIALYVANLQNKQQKEYIEKQNELDKNVKEYELLYQYITKLIDDINEKHDKLITTLNDLTLETDELKQYQYLLNISYYIGNLNNTTKITVESIKSIMSKMNADTSLLDAQIYMSKLQTTRNYISNEISNDITYDNIATLSKQINEIEGAKNIFIENLNKTISTQLKQTYE